MIPESGEESRMRAQSSYGEHPGIAANNVMGINKDLTIQVCPQQRRGNKITESHTHNSFRRSSAQPVREWPFLPS